MPVVSKHMSRDLLFVEPDLALVDAAQRMHQRGVGAVMVKEGDRLAGILTERDLVRFAASGADSVTFHVEVAREPAAVAERAVEEPADRDDTGRGHAVAQRGERAVVDQGPGRTGRCEVGVLVGGGRGREDLVHAVGH